MIRSYSQESGVGGLRLSVLLILSVLIVLSAAVVAQEEVTDGKNTGQPGSMIRSGALYSVEFREQCGPPWLQSTLGTKVMMALRKAGIGMQLGGATPMVSQESVEYSIVATQGDTDLRTGRIFAEVGPGSELNFKNTEGKAVVVQIDLTKICWDVDLDAAVEEAKKVGADHAIVARFGVEDLTSEVNAAGAIGKQKSFRVNVDLYVINTSSGSVVDAYSGERRTMDVSREGAISSSGEQLAANIVKAMEDSRKNGIIGW